MAFTLGIPSRASSFANGARRLLPYFTVFWWYCVHIHFETYCIRYISNAQCGQVIHASFQKTISYEATLQVAAMLPSGHVQRVPFVLPFEYGRAAIFNPKLPYFRQSWTTSAKRINGVCVRYLIASKHVWHGPYAVMRYSLFFGGPVYVPILTPTVYSIFPNYRVDEICRSFSKQQQVVKPLS